MSSDSESASIAASDARSSSPAASDALSRSASPAPSADAADDAEASTSSAGSAAASGKQQKADTASSTVLTTEPKTTTSFRDLGLLPELCTACASLGFKAPSEIQQECIPYALQGKDIIGLAQTGSGKTAAFALPILHHLWQDPQGLFAVVLAPTRSVDFFPSRELFSALN